MEKRGRGRPRKRPPDEAGDAQEPLAPPTTSAAASTKRRGRPRKQPGGDGGIADPDAGKAPNGSAPADASNLGAPDVPHTPIHSAYFDRWVVSGTASTPPVAEADLLERFKQRVACAIDPSANAGDGAEAQEREIALFECVQADGVDASPRNHGARGGPGRIPRASCGGWSAKSDFVLNVGGPAWSVAWCPSVRAIPSSDRRATYLAIGAHSRDHEANVINVPISGPGLIQIWTATCDPPRLEESAGSGGGPAPHIGFSFGIVHQAAVVWHLAWCPDPQLLREATKAKWSRAGLLAAAMGDGRVCVYAVPFEGDDRISAARARSGSGSGSGSGARHGAKGGPREGGGGFALLTLPPVAEATVLAERGSMPSSVQWHPVAPHDVLLAGCWDGSVALFALTSGSGSGGGGAEGEGEGGGAGDGKPQMVPVSLIQADIFPIRAVAWVYERGQSIEDATHFATAGQSGQLRFWDMHEPHTLVSAVNYSSFVHIMDIALCSVDPPTMVVALSDGNIALCNIKRSLGVSKKHVSKSCVFSVAYDPSEEMGAITTASGELLLYDLVQTLSKQEPLRLFSYTCMGCMAVDVGGGEGGGEGGGKGGGESKLVVRTAMPHKREEGEVVPTVLPPTPLHTYRVHWGPIVDPKSRSLAYGTASGLARVTFLGPNLA